MRHFPDSATPERVAIIETCDATPRVFPLAPSDSRSMPLAAETPGRLSLNSRFVMSASRPCRLAMITIDSVFRTKLALYLRVLN